MWSSPFPGRNKLKSGSANLPNRTGSAAFYAEKPTGYAIDGPVNHNCVKVKRQNQFLVLCMEEDERNVTD
ncbi:hypothetical protein DS742_14585 [Lacrimispora amygdalina]|uniref:Uncharacterized protein n=1 Tax=Lacrimispora amygdalina TaxID=253257 RepID=A0A3E2NAU3_9FIRM|nr:hypothetical protein DS742_14585 [Clostridium indicum]